MKKTSVLNFNLVFYSGDREEPLLEHLDTVVMPALTENIIRGDGDTKYFLMDTKIREDSDGEYILTGLLIKKTILEVKSDIDEQGKLIEKDDKYPTAPFSMFIIYLKNHRMLYIENQKGSPDVRSFKATIKYILNTYVKKRNKELEKVNKELPIPILNVTGIPMRRRIDEALKDVEKINELKLRFYPLNGDIDYTGLLEGVATDLRRKVGCKNGEIILKSPSNISGVIEVLSKSGGTVDPIFSVRYADKKKGKIKNEEISEKMEIELSGNDPNEEIENAIEKGKKISSIAFVSKENNDIYEKNTKKIISFVKRD
ncbi:hypothetical protein DWY31_04385 [Dorea sp. AF24-7LB]|uniref:hypothetical protein n=1 Tax=Dorea sp. AF24-7LB TaxID=2293097 RepID=UPI000E4F3272|nr:hypothetical protein [Dorea sp. AF24-7LB]RHQ56463.1 hypothetical protein DWY31_04385 [Dorea sp. AF24-7LB]